MNKIDFHTHFFPDNVAAKAMPVLAATARAVVASPCTDGTEDETRKRMAEWGISKAVLCSIATNRKQTENVNRFAARFLNDRLFVPFCSVYPTATDATESLRELKAQGFRGVKLHPEYQEFSVEDERVFPVYEFCQRNGMILTLHAGFDPAYPHRRMAPPAKIAAVVRNFPGLRLVAAHGGGQLMWEESIRELSKSGAYIDLSCVGSVCDEALFKRLLYSFPEDKILFATDCPWSTANVTDTALERASLPKDVLDMIYHANAERLLNVNLTE